MRVVSAGLAALLSICTGLAAGAAQANDSVYTKLDLDENCAVIVPFDEDEPGSGVEWICLGHQGIGVYVAEGDLRFTMTPLIDGLPRTPDYLFEMPDFETVSGFNRLNDTLEWRLGADGKPVATILRWFVDDGQGTGKEDQVLVVTRAMTGGQCHVARINASRIPNANELARQIADTRAAAFRCGVDQPEIIE